MIFSLQRGRKFRRSSSNSSTEKKLALPNRESGSGHYLQVGVVPGGHLVVILGRGRQIVVVVVEIAVRGGSEGALTVVEGVAVGHAPVDRVVAHAVQVKPGHLVYW